jgi:predicted O-methyltransferase YrrM
MELHVISSWFDTFPQKKAYFEEVADKSKFPIVNFETQTIKANRMHRALLDHGETFAEKMGIIKKYIGAYATRDNQPFTTARLSAIMSMKVTPSMELDPFIHGWYSQNTRRALEGAVQYYKPKHVVELGVWYGKSTSGLFQAAKNKIHYYGFDFFSPTATQPSYVTKTPMDKLFVEHFRLESAVSNVARFAKKHDIHYIFEDVMKSPAVLRKLGVIPDLVFIDAIKEIKPLREIIEAYMELNPNIVIVGDDYIFESTRKAVSIYPIIPFGNNAYIYTKREVPSTFPEPVSDFSSYPQLKLTAAEKASLPSSLKGYLED